MNFKLVSPYAPTGDQPQAIEKLVAGLDSGMKKQVLLGVTGSGKTFTMANVIAKINKPTLVLAHNKWGCQKTLTESFVPPTTANRGQNRPRSPQKCRNPDRYI